MVVPSRIEEIAGKLNAYAEQIAALSKALEALKVVGDLVSASLTEDRMSILALVEANAVAERSDYTVDLDSSDPAEELVAANEVSDEGLVEGLAAEFVEPADPADDIDEDADLSIWASELSGAHEGQAADAVVAETLIPVSSEIETADMPVPVISETADAVGVATAEPDAAATTSDASIMIAQIAAAADVSEGKVIDLASRREKQKSAALRPSRGRAIGFVAAMLVAAIGTAGLHEFLETGMAQQFIGIASCDAEAAAASRECAVLAWLML